MKPAQNLFVVALLMLSMSAHAQSESTWDRLSTTVKVKVQEWMTYFAPAPAPAPAVVVRPAAPPPAVVPVPVNTPPVAPVEPRVASKPNQPSVNTSAAPRPKAPAVTALREAIAKKNILRVSSAGRRGTSPLARNHDGVPLTDWRDFKKVGKIVPKLDVGMENSVAREDFALGQIDIPEITPIEAKRLSTPNVVGAAEIYKLVGTPPTRVYGARGLQANLKTVGQPIAREAIDKIQFEARVVRDVKLKPYRAMSDEELQMVAALILYNRGDHCHMVMGLFSRLAAQDKTKNEAHYYLGACATKLKMNQVAFDNLSYLVGREDAEFGPGALELLAKNLPVMYEGEFYHVLKGVKNLKALTTAAAQEHVAYRMAKGAYRAGDFKTSLELTKKITAGSEYADDAQVLMAMDQFALNDKQGSLKTLRELSASLESRKLQDKNIRALTQVNLARLYFGQKQYDLAFKAYMQVPKDHPLWVQALIEQGWTQLALADNAGAIGNMYSLHSPYFKTVYQPESFVVRAIGYLNICQYGDAYRTLTWLEKDYRDMFDHAQSYFKNKSEPVAVYDTVKTYIRGKSTDNVEGVPFQVWRDLARRKDFLNLQTALNDKQDEAHRYDGVNQKIKEEKAGIRARAETSKKRFDQFHAQVTKVRNVAGVVHGREDSEAGMKRERENALGYRFQLQILELSREGFLAFQTKAQSKLDAETHDLTLQAGQALVRHAKDMSTQMQGVLDNNEFLRYEVFSGSGEDIRYQVAGGQVGQKNRIPASIKPAKMLNWSFDGEFWEDEIGSYRSSLRNVCPTQPGQSGPVQSQAAGEDDDAN